MQLYTSSPLLHCPIIPIVFTLNDSLGSQGIQCRRIVSERVQDFIGVFAQDRRRGKDRRGRAAHLHRVTHQLHLAHLGMFHFGGESVGTNLWVGENFVEGIDRRRGHVSFDQSP